MKICIPTIDDRGKEARLSDHFGSAPCFTMFDTGWRHWTTIANAQAHHARGECNPTASIRSEAVDVVVCRGLGRRALERLHSTGVEVFTTREMVAGRAVDAFSAGRLNAMTPQEGCGGGRGECHDHDHGTS